MDKTEIRDFNGRIIGYIEIDRNGNKVLRDFYNRIIGYYYVSDDTTRDFYQRIIFKGDALTSLIGKGN